MEIHRLQFVLYFVVLLFMVSFGANTPPDYVEKHFDQKLDHFNFVTYADKTFKQRYLIQDKWWNQGKGPIFFYTGNEGPITAFWAATGFVFDIAPQFGALVVFAEHRYYGETLPFGNATFEPANMGLLTVEQALADYALLIKFLKQSLNATGCPVITFGGSYGGMLSVYMRFKYPNMVTGSIAASAPINLLTQSVDRSFFFAAVTKDFSMATPQCESRVRQAFILMMNTAAEGASGLKKLSEIFKLCKPLASNDDYFHLLGWIRNSFTNLAMFDYPYPTDFFSKLPGYPVKVACQYMEDAIDVVEGLAKAAGLFYNGTAGTMKCFDIFKEFVECADQTGCGVGPDSKAWDFQACTEIPLVGGSTNVTDMFPAMPWTPDMRHDYCYKRWKVTPRDTWSDVEFWGKDIASASNIVFSNGDLDPWRGGGVLSNVGSEITLVNTGGAHCFDLAGQNSHDPISVKAAREVEKAAIRKWINT
ncbi:dipeptidyl peptidase 2-like isoform X2 [Mercenaria mercenaria]|uniref:dipeptidyl peptidase 2-like isoform X2 n=1 Tax=Mercenaria mercenaria TaxID=6596 RepID=UPI00234F86A9|nr:dipeptidyl peptidase 2-like isoform X2 [Mercenaria mercenaria]